MTRRGSGRATLALVVACVLSAPTAAYAAVPAPGAGPAKVAATTRSTTTPLTQPQPLSRADLNPGGANNGGACGAYCSTRDGSLAQNGQAKSGQVAGSRGAADNKFPPGQAPNGTDHNNGYECDGNRGIGVSNPAHTGCATPPPPPPRKCVAGTTVTVRWGAVELGRPGQYGLVERAATRVSLLPGTYTVKLRSTDVNHRAGFQTNQDHEQWYVVLKQGGAKVATSGTIADLPDALTTMTRAVGTVTLPRGADAAVATHLYAGTTSWRTPESIQPAAAVFTCV